MKTSASTSHLRARTILVAVVAAALVASCGGRSPRTQGTSRTEATGGATSTAPSSPSTSSSPCPLVGATADVRVDYPNRLSTLVGKSVRTGAHPCFERFVIELQEGSRPANGFPGYWVRYVSGPILLMPSGLPTTIRGGSVLLVSVGSWMSGPDAPGYTGARDVVPTNVSVIREYQLIEDFEGQSTWALGIDTARRFVVSILSNPARLVIDVQIAP